MGPRVDCRVMKKTVLLALALAACGTSEASTSGPPLVDDIHNGNCNAIAEYTMTQTGTGSVSTITYYAAVFDVDAGTEEPRGMVAFKCGLEENAPVATCPGAFSCSGDLPPNPDCGAVFPQVVGKTVRVDCGTKTVTNGVVQPGYRHLRATLHVY